MSTKPTPRTKTTWHSREAYASDAKRRVKPVPRTKTGKAVTAALILAGLSVFFSFTVLHTYDDLGSVNFVWFTLAPVIVLVFGAASLIDDTRLSVKPGARSTVGRVLLATMITIVGVPIILVGIALIIFVSGNGRIG